MILILLSTILIIPVLIGWGRISEYLSTPLFEGISGKVFSGILTVSLIWTILSFFIPLKIYVEIPTILLGLFYFFKDKLYQEFTLLSKKDSLLFTGSLLIILFCGSFYPYMIDHFGYYIPTIKWLTEVGMVKGISNLNLVLGQMSIWHIFQAGFSNFTDPFLRINTILLIVYIVYIIEKKSWIHLCFLPFLLMFSQSPSPDLPVIIFSLIILNEIVKQNKETAILFTFSAFVFAIKPTMIWLPILSCLYSVFIIKSGFKNLIPGILILILFCIKNIYTFGYPVFPVSVGDIGISWKPNPDILKTSSQIAIQKTYDMQYSYLQIQQFSWFDYVKNWFFLHGMKSKINILLVISLIIFTGFAFIKKNRIITLICISILIKSILIILFSAQYRFFIDVFFVIFFVMFINYFDKKKSLIIFSVFSLFFVGFISIPQLVKKHLQSFYLGNFMKEPEIEQLYKPSVYKAIDYNSYKIGNLNFNVSKKYPLNYSTPLPAISEGYVFEYIKAGIFPQLIDETDTESGFIWKKLNSKEKKEADNVINSINNLYKQK
ncbi:LIC_10190 family membrane protein [Chryseobacterium geocarposphaerae]|uniref:DUF8201 domain-containing protein n=1 Tax=Chryseobacterium geocarposphaerae TaxID=1416776 RepID=A0A2M9CAX8_9FLAO|nr:hypothetical protein [Chryseobacterium geocarposphaerae]PJJ68003.1 hypothetical protein CLV73_2026 [Chryseobacterium geocarposphaerae]